MPVVGWKCQDCGKALWQINEKAVATGEFQTVWAVVNTEDWCCEENNGDEHRAVAGEGTWPYEVEFTIIQHVWATDPEQAYDVASTKAIEAGAAGAFSNYDDAVRRITPQEF